MNRRLFLLTLTLAASTVAASAASIYHVTLNTPGLVGQDGYIDFMYNPAPNATETPTATLSNFLSSGYTYNSAMDLAVNAVGVFPGPIVITADANSAANYYDVAVTNFGSTFSFDLLLAGVTANTAFRLTLYNSDFTAFLASPLPEHEVLNVTFGANNVATATGSVFAGGSASAASATELPEPGTMWLGGVSLLAAVALRRR